MRAVACGTPYWIQEDESEWLIRKRYMDYENSRRAETPLSEKCFYAMNLSEDEFNKNYIRLKKKFEYPDNDLRDVCLKSTL